MDLIEILRNPEGKTLEFKRDLSSPAGFTKTRDCATGHFMCSNTGHFMCSRHNLLMRI